MVLARWEGLPLLAWLPLRLLYRLQGPYEWALDPEHVGFVTPLQGDVPAIDLDDVHPLDLIADGDDEGLEDDEDPSFDDELADDDVDEHPGARRAGHPDSDGDLLW